MLKRLRQRSADRALTPLSTTVVDQTRYSVRFLRTSDYAAWRATRLAAQERLAAAFGDPGVPWSAVNSPTAWVEWSDPLLQAARDGRAVPLAILEHGPDGTRLIGEMGMSGIDPVTRSGEVYAWLADAPAAIAPWALANVIRTAFTPRYGLDRVLAPVARGNAGPARALRRAGLVVRADRRDLRLYGGAPHDHDLWVIENTPDNRAAVAELAA